MPTRSSRTELEARLICLAVKNRDVKVGFGGYGTNVGELANYCKGLPHEIIWTLKELHLQGGLHLLYWNREISRFGPWTVQLADTFFNDFRMLTEKPFATV